MQHVSHHRQHQNRKKWHCQNTEFANFVDLEVRKSDYTGLTNVTFCPIQQYSAEYLQQILEDSTTKYKNS